MNIILNPKSQIFIIPNIISEENNNYINRSYYTNILNNIHVFYVENLKNARHFIKFIDTNIVIDNFIWHLLNEPLIPQIPNYFKQNYNIGIISDSGYPCIADPGNNIISLAHKHHINTVPLIGPSAILLALVCSGLNGQQFSFHGYLPIKEIDKNKAIKNLEQTCIKNNATQIFIETPYRNNQMLNSLLQQCNPKLSLCIAADITGQQQFIKTKTIAEWKKQKYILNKTPTIFLLAPENNYQPLL